MIKTTTLLLAALVAAPAFAADLPAAAPAATAPAPAPATRIELEVSPEFGANSASPSYQQLADFYFKGSLGHSIGNGFSVGSSFQWVDKTSAPNTAQDLLDASLAYKFKLNDNFSITTTGGVGYTWDATGIGAGGVQPFLYYFATAALDARIDSHWTWNILNARYRNGRGVTWYTPKVQTGITYTIDSANAVYAKSAMAGRTPAPASPPTSSTSPWAINTRSKGRDLS